MLDLEFFQNFFFQKKFFLLQNSFLSEVDYISTVFFYFVHTVGGVETSSFSRDFRFFTDFLNLIMHIGGLLSFRLV